MVFPIVFLILYQLVVIGKLISKTGFFLLLPAALAFGIRYCTGLFYWYERDRLNPFKDIFRQLPDLFSLSGVHHFYHTYSIYLSVFLLSVIMLIRLRQYAGLTLLLAGSFSYWVLIMVTAPSEVHFYAENMLLPLGFMLGIPLFETIAPRYPVMLLTVFFCFIYFGFMAYRKT